MDPLLIGVVDDEKLSNRQGSWLEGWIERQMHFGDESALRKEILGGHQALDVWSLYESLHQRPMDRILSYGLRRVWGSAIRRSDATKSPERLRERLANANDYFRKKASEVLTDESALGLLTSIYEGVVVEIVDFDFCNNGMALAKLTAANFAEIGANVIYITEAGQRFINSIEDSQSMSKTS